MKLDIQNKEALHFYEQGMIAIFEDKKEKAELLLLKALEIESNSSIYGSLAWFYGHLMKEYDKAFLYFRKALKNNPAKGDFYNDCGAVLLKLGKQKESVKWFNRALKLSNYTKKHIALYNLALVFHSAGDLGKSKNYLKLALDYQPNFWEAKNLYHEINCKE